MYNSVTQNTMPAKSKFLQGRFSEKGRQQLGKTPFAKLILASFVLNIATIAFVLLSRNRLPPLVPLFYGQVGEEQLSSSYELVLPSIISFSSMVINLGLSWILQDEFLRKTLILASVISVFFATITTLKITFLVGSF